MLPTRSLRVEYAWNYLIPREFVAPVGIYLVHRGVALQNLIPHSLILLCMEADW
jgi:hypothetical protein